MSEPDAAPSSGPLPRRATDRVEDAAAWMLMAAALLLIVMAGVTGLTAHGRTAERAALESGSKSQVRAVLLDDARIPIGPAGEHGTAQVSARWADRDGREHSGPVVVESSHPAGAEVNVWIDAAGAATSSPVRPEHALVTGIAAAIGVVCAGGTLLVVAWLGVRCVTGRVNARRWEQEWALVEPQWRRNML